MAGDGQERPYFVANQVIVTGPEAAVDSVVGEVQEKSPLKLELKKRLNLGELLDASVDGRLPPQHEIAIVLYEIPGGKPEDVIKLVADINQLGKEKAVVAEPNYLIGDPYTGGAPRAF